MTDLDKQTLDVGRMVTHRPNQLTPQSEEMLLSFYNQLIKWKRPLTPKQIAWIAGLRSRYDFSRGRR